MRILIVILAFYCSAGLQAQNLDSIYKAAVEGQNDSLAVMTLVKQMFQVVYRAPDSALSLANKAIDISRKSEDPALIARGYNIRGIAQDVKGLEDSALASYKIAQRYAEKAIGQERTILLAQVLNNIGLIFWNRAQFERAIDFYFRSLKMFESLNMETLGIPNTLSNIAVIYDETGNSEKALEYHKKALAKRLQMDDEYGQGVSYTNLGVMFNAIGQYDSSAYYARMAIAIKKKSGDQHGLALNYTNVGNNFLHRRSLDSAYYYFKNSLDIFKGTGNEKRAAVNYSALGEVYWRQNKLDTATLYIDSAIAIAQNSEAGDVLANAYLRKAWVDTSRGDFKAAYFALKNGADAERSVFNVEKEELLNTIATRYETTKREKELIENKAALAEEKLRVQNRDFWIYALSGGLLMIVILGVLFYRQLRFKQQKLKEEARLKQELAKAELKQQVEAERVRISRDLHDHIGAQLTIISSKVDNLQFRESDAKRKAEYKAISDHSRETMGQLRETIWAMNNEAIDLEMLVAKIRDFTQKLAQGKQRIMVENKAIETIQLTPSQTINIFRVCQEAINNAVKYSGFTELVISANFDGGLVQLEVRDNGAGFEVEQKLKGGYGLRNMRERMRQIGGELVVESTPEEGTMVKALLPVNTPSYV